MVSELSDAELEELLEGFKSQEPESKPEERLIPTQQEITLQTEDKPLYTDMFRQFIRFALHPRRVYNNQEIDEQIQPAYERMTMQTSNSIRASYLYMLLRIAFEKLCQKYDFPFGIYIQFGSNTLVISDRSMSLLLQPSFLEQIGIQLDTIAQQLPQALETEFNTFMSRIDDNDIEFLHGKQYTDEMIIKIKERKDQLQQTMHDTLTEIPDKFLDALMFRYCFGVLVLATTCMLLITTERISGRIQICSPTPCGHLVGPFHANITWFL